MDLSALFHSTSIAVVGVSRDPNKVGHQIFKNLLLNKSLHLFPINPHADEILDTKAFTSLSLVQERIDLVVIAVPAPVVEPIIDECIAKKVQAIVIITAGFAEQGEQGKIIQVRIAEKLSQANITLLGPNTMGFIDPYRNMYASFSAERVDTGSIALISQSGAMLSALFQAYDSAHTGVSFAVSVGNKGGLTELECIEYAEQDEHTKIVVLYLESFSNIPQFMKLAKRVSRIKPVFLLRGGVTSEGLHAAVSHTAALATPQALLTDAAEQAGIVLLDTFEQCVRASIAASRTVFLPEHLMIVTNAGGPAVVMIDEASTSHIPLSTLSSRTTLALQSVLPKIVPQNPLDLLGDASSRDLDEVLTILAQDPQIDAIAVLITQQSVTNMDEISQVLLKPRGKKVLFVSFIGGDQLEIYREKIAQAGVIMTRYPNEIIETLRALMQARTYMLRPHQDAHIQTTQQRDFPNTFEQLQSLLTTYGLHFPQQKIIAKKEEVSSLASLSAPLIAKTTNLELTHKAQLGAVIGNVCDIGYAKTVFDHLQAWNHPVVFQEMITGSKEALVGFALDPQFGWFMAVGIGGSMSDAIADRAYCFLPATREEMSRTLKKTRLSTVLTQPQTRSFLDTLEQLQACVLAIKDLKELEINPLFITENAMIVADMKRR